MPTPEDIRRRQQQQEDARRRAQEEDARRRAQQDAAQEGIRRKEDETLGRPLLQPDLVVQAAREAARLDAARRQAQQDDARNQAHVEEAQRLTIQIKETERRQAKDEEQEKVREECKIELIFEMGKEEITIPQIARVTKKSEEEVRQIIERHKNS